MNRFSKTNDSSSSSSLDGLSFILEESSDDEHILKYFLDNDNDKGTLELIKRLRQAREEKRPLSSSASRRPRKKKKGSLGETAKKHTNVSTKIILLKTPSTLRRIFAADFRSGDTFSFAL